MALRLNAGQKQAVMARLKGFDKESHAKSLAEGILRTCRDEPLLNERIEKANAVVSTLREAGITSFFAAEYAKVFEDPQTALAVRERLTASFNGEYGLAPRHAAKMADCVIFSAAKKPEANIIDRMANLASAALAAGVEFNVVADTVYYNQPDVDGRVFALKCAIVSAKKGKELGISQNDLAARLATL